MINIVFYTYINMVYLTPQPCFSISVKGHTSAQLHDPQMHGAIMQALCPPEWLTEQENALMMAPCEDQSSRQM